jgi:hypothetical protein
VVLENAGVPRARCVKPRSSGLPNNSKPEQEGLFFRPVTCDESRFHGLRILVVTGSKTPDTTAQTKAAKGVMFIFICLSCCLINIESNREQNMCYW